MAQARKNFQVQVGLVGDQPALVPAGTVFHLMPGLVQAQHGATHKSVLVLVLAQTQQQIGAVQHIQAEYDIVVHHQNMGDAGTLLVCLQDLDHAAGKAARTAHIAVGHDVDDIAVQTFRVQGLSIVRDEHFQMPVQQRVLFFDHFPANPLQVAQNKGFPAEGTDINADLGIPKLFLRHFGHIGAAIADAGLQCQQRKGQKAACIGREGQLHNPLFFQVAFLIQQHNPW